MRATSRGIVGTSSRAWSTQFSRGICPQCSRASSSTSGELSRIIHSTIKATGPISTSRYMQLCLTHPTLGYYSKRDVFGKKGDFTTSPEISQIFGELMAIWFITRLQDTNRSFRIIELGPGRGTLMDDILRTFFQFPMIEKRLKEIWMIERSHTLRGLQENKMKDRLKDRDVQVTWKENLDIPESELFTLIIAHEFFDAIPVDIFENTREGFRQVMVDTNTQMISFGLSPSPTSLSTVLPATSPRFLKAPIGSKVEIAPESWRLMRRLGESLRHGGAGLVIDYGGAQYFGSSFRAFRDHKIVDVFEDPGEVDMTANVDFAYLQESLKDLARPLGPIPQADFLLALGLQPRLTKLITSSPEARRKDIESGAKRLIDRTGMGKQYQVMGMVGSEEDGEVYPFV